MTKKDYVLLAKAIKEARKASNMHYSEEAQNGITMVIEFLSDALYHENNRFQTDKFIDACRI